MKQVSKEAQELIARYDLSVEDFTPSELKEIEQQVEWDRQGMMYMDGVEYFLFPKVQMRKINMEFKDRENGQ